MISILIGLALQKSPAIYTQFAEELHAATSVTIKINVTVKSEYGTTQVEDSDAFMKPNFWRVESSVGGRAYGVHVSDGRNMWVYDAIQNRLERQDPPKEGFLETEFLLDPFLGAVDSGGIPDGKVADARFHGHEAICVEVTKDGRAPKSGASTTEVLMDPTSHLPIGMIFDAPSRKMRYDIEVESLKINSPLTKADFQYEPKVALHTTKGNGGTYLPIGSIAPTFKGVQIGGKPLDLLHEMKGAKAVILDFWQIGCEPCKAELPKFEKLQEEMGARGLRIITIAVYNDEEDITNYAKEKGLALPIVFSRSCKPDVVYKYKATSWPLTYLISGDGKIVAEYTDANIKSLRSDLAKLGL